MTDTTGSMGTLGAYFRENDLEHGYCTNHSLHCNAILVFNGQWMCAIPCVPLSRCVLTPIVLSDQNIQGADGAMSAAHMLVGYFFTLTQASGHLIEVQKGRQHALVIHLAYPSTSPSTEASNQPADSNK